MRVGRTFCFTRTYFATIGQGSVADGARIDVVVQTTARGLQAVEVLRIDAARGPAGRCAAGRFRGVSPEEIAEAALEPARVKWFDKAKGFGFANVFGKPEDVFIHIEVCAAPGFRICFPGEALALRVDRWKVAGAWLWRCTHGKVRLA